MEIVDAQIHIWNMTEDQWPGGIYVPAWARKGPFTESDALKGMDAAGVDRAIIVTAGFTGDNNDVPLAAARRHPDRFAVMGRIPLRDPQSPGRLKNWMSQPGMLGVRLAFFTPEHEVEFRRGDLDWIWPIAQEAGVPLMIYPSPALLPAIDTIAAHHPRLKMIIDHMAMTPDYSKKDEAAFEHMPLLMPLSRHSNVAVKATNIPTHCAAPYPFRPMHAPLRKVVEAFGPERVFWGTDVTGLRCSWREAVTMVTEEMDFLSQEDKTWIMGRGVRQWLNWT